MIVSLGPPRKVSPKEELQFAAEVKNVGEGYDKESPRDKHAMPLPHKKVRVSQVLYDLPRGNCAKMFIRPWERFTTHVEFLHRELAISVIKMINARDLAKSCSFQGEEKCSVGTAHIEHACIARTPHKAQEETERITIAQDDARFPT